MVKLIFSILIIPAFLQAQIKKELFIEIADFYEFKSAAVSLTFDDGSVNQFTVGLKGLDSMSFKGTFFINPGFLGEKNWALMKNLIKAGHEVGSHTMTHPHLKEINLDQARIEIKQSKAVIEQNINNYQCISFAYPFGESNENIRQITSSYFQAARTTDGGFFPVDASYNFKIPGFLFSSGTKLITANKWVNNAIHNNKWIVEIFHGFENDGWSPISSSLYLSHLQYIKSKEDYLWVTTFGNAIKYFKEHQSAKIELTDSSFNYYKLNVTDNLPDSIYDFPLTMRVKIPDRWTQIKVLQNNITVNFQLQSDVCKNQYVVFDVIPDHGEMTITSEKVATLDSANCNYCNPIAFPNPFNQTLSILSGPLIKGTIHIYGSSSACIFTGELDSEHFKIDTSTWSKGVYIMMINLNDSSKIIKRIVVKQ